ncbi:pilus assembly FimT family protein [Anthocerotibacter panamensis]|uniref:pilus assembly FimT family protein n=1 Tax=Anthocerotibacter panamensis TaxID=2857077 RepID=UPI001C40336C|nr:prepilin-type N-terminal cleavage/methylation domain-containing protein [Anthocerotibacter panamensis]
MKRAPIGVSLPELLITVIIAGILATLALPNIGAQIENQSLKEGQQRVQQALRDARQLAITQTRTISVQFFDFNGGPATTLGPPNTIRICEATSCTGAAWAASPFQQEITLPQSIEIRRVSIFDGSGICTFSSQGSIPVQSLSSQGSIPVQPLGTIYLRRTSAPLVPAIEAGGLTPAQENLIASPDQGAGYSAVVISTLLGKIRSIR